MLSLSVRWRTGFAPGAWKIRRPAQSRWRTYWSWCPRRRADAACVWRLQGVPPQTDGADFSRRTLRWQACFSPVTSRLSQPRQRRSSHSPRCFPLLIRPTCLCFSHGCRRIAACDGLLTWRRVCWRFRRCLAKGRCLRTRSSAMRRVNGGATLRNWNRFSSPH